MQYIQLKSWKTNENLFSGHFINFKTCLETAIDKNVNLDYILIEHQDLALANLDGAMMNYARMRYCNLRGANLSECELEKSQWGWL